MLSRRSSIPIFISVYFLDSSEISVCVVLKHLASVDYYDIDLKCPKVCSY